MKKFLNVVISSFLCASLVMTPVFATPEGTPSNGIEEPTAEVTETEIPEEPVEETPDENGHYSVEYTHDIQPETNSLPSWPQGPLINSESAILMDMDTGEILYGKNPYKKQYPASITKLLTVLVALDYIQVDDTVEFSQESIDFLKPGDAHIAMQPGEVISMTDALYAILFASANEVSYAVAENVGKKYLNGGFDEFIQKMNEKSDELGCKNSNWVNANGLHDDEHYTTAYDMALIGAAIYENPLFNEMMEQFEHVIPPTNLVDEQRVFQQHHKMTWDGGKYYYEYCKGGKTGYTDNAQTTLVTLSDDGNRRFVAVILYDRGGKAYDQTRELFDYGYSQFEKVNPQDVNTDGDITAFLDVNQSLSLPEGVSLNELDSKVEADNDEYGRGTVTYSYKDNPMGTFNVKLSDEAYESLTKDAGDNPVIEEETSKVDDDSKEAFIKALHISIIVVITLIIIVFIVFLVKLYQYKKRKRLRALKAKKRKQALMAKKRREEALRQQSKKNTRR